MIELIELTKEYPGSSQPAVDRLNLTIFKGETIALLGPSGCGKTSVLSMIVGLEKPTAGDIQIDGQSIVKVPVEKRGIGLVFQDYAIFTSMTVRGNLAFGLTVRKTPKSEIASKVNDTASFLGLTPILDVKASRLSGSELQRVALGRTLVTRPSILLLDEPLSNLEPEARLATRQELRRLRQELGLTIIYVTHDQVEALSLADRLAIMSFGRILQVEKTSVILEKPKLVQVAQFLGSPPMNIFQGFFHQDNGYLAFRQGAVDLRLPFKSLSPKVELGSARFYHLGLRPEDLDFTEESEPFFRGQVSGLENRGFDSVVSLANGNLEMKALDPQNVFTWGETVAVKAKAESFFLFDKSGRLMEGQLFEANHD
ncbi:MAG: ABC transporter ATP-binding protein [Deltaproteobacteria bacterium]|jgi:multiple sugar transport system ATP-binding protein|nr:ABC transporter ATP-binding protein [Deltaproteobacteria bacterium]